MSACSTLVTELVERPTLGNSTEMFDALTGPGGQFEIVFDRDGVVLAKRVRPPDPGEVLPGTPAALADAATQLQEQASTTTLPADASTPGPSTGSKTSSAPPAVVTVDDAAPPTDVASGVPGSG